MKVIGLTGSFGTGKTTVASIFKSLGARVIDADKIAHSSIKKGTPAHKRIVSAFGDRILTKGGEIDRKSLGRKVFASRKNIERLNRIIHPAVISYIKKSLRKIAKDAVVVIDAPLLIEANLAGLADLLIVVKASRENQVARCMKKFKMKRIDVLKRIGHQIPVERKIGMADFVIDNDGTRSETRIQVRKVWEGIWR